MRLSLLVLTLLLLVPCIRTLSSPYILQYEDVIIDGDSIVKYVRPKDPSKTPVDDVFIPSSFTTSDGKEVSVSIIGQMAFTFAFRKVVVGPGFKRIGASAFNNRLLEELVLSEGIEEIGKRAFGSASLPEVGLSELEIPASVRLISEAAFCDQPIGRIVFHEGLTRIGRDAFFNCGLTSLTLPNSVEVIETDAFALNDITSFQIPESCKYLSGFADNPIVNIEIPGSVKVVGVSAFERCMSLESIVVSDGVEEIRERAFSFGSSLHSVTLSPLPLSLRLIGQSAFASASIPVLEFAEGTSRVTKGAFSGAKIGRLVLPESLEVIEAGAFSASGLTSLSLPPNLSQIGDFAFYACPLSDVELFSNSALSVGAGAFANNPKVRNIVIRQGVERIGYGCFLPRELCPLVNVDLIGASDLKEVEPRAFDWVSLACADIDLPKSDDVVWRRYKAEPQNVDLSTVVSSICYESRVDGGNQYGYVAYPSAPSALLSVEAIRSTPVYDVMGHRLGKSSRSHLVISHRRLSASHRHSF